METQFTTRRAFATYALANYGMGYLKDADWRDRIIGVAQAVTKLSNYGVENYGVERAYDVAAYGLGWSFETRRLNYGAETALRAMSIRQLLMLIHELRCHCSVVGDVPAYLNNKYRQAV